MRCVWLLVSLSGCVAGGLTAEAGDAASDSGRRADGAFDTDAANPDAADPDSGLPSDAASGDVPDPDAAEIPGDMAPPPDAAPPPPPPPGALDCVFDSDTVGEPALELDVGPNSGERLTFVVRGLPAPAFVEQATLTFDVYDADHPGEEGRIRVNGSGPFDIPARVEWDNVATAVTVDISGATVEGGNRVEFGPGPRERSFFHISDVRIAARARVEVCPEGPPPPPPPPPEARVREIRYPAAEYTNRRTWVLGCENNGARAYAYTARAEEHEPTDCEGLYRAGGDRRGDGIFRFPAVVDATYDIVVGSRHTENRNPRGALFLVNGEARRISQRSDRDFTEDIWGQRRLSGDVEVILRAEGESDSVTFVRLVPRGG